jgi:hypothetical protein
MDIRNVTQFCNFITSNGFNKSNGSLQQIVSCIDGYSAACNCHKVEDKQKMYAICNKLYSDAIKHIVPTLKHEFLSKTSERQIIFYSDNGTLISILSR